MDPTQIHGQPRESHTCKRYWRTAHGPSSRDGMSFFRGVFPTSAELSIQPQRKWFRLRFRSSAGERFICCSFQRQDSNRRRFQIPADTAQHGKVYIRQGVAAPFCSMPTKLPTGESPCHISKYAGRQFHVLKSADIGVSVKNGTSFGSRSANELSPGHYQFYRCDG